MLRHISAIGLLLMAISLGIPAYWFWQLALQGHVFALFSQYLGVAALITMAFVQLFATRWLWLEWIFGPLDKLYVLHKWLGIGALAMVFLHNNINADAGSTTANTGWLASLIGGAAESLGGFSFDMLQILLLITVILLIPYHWWRWTHKLIGIAFALGAVHFAFIEKPYSNSHPISVYTLTFCAIGVFSYLYTLLPERWLRRTRDYTVKSVEHSGGATLVTLSPVKKGFKFRAGQFAFVTFDEKKLKESHPFTISRTFDKQNRDLRFSIKTLGDYTNKLPHLMTEGMTASVQGPFGKFALKPNHPQIWIAAGIGITPFVAWAQKRKQEAELFPDKKRQPIHWFYCFRDKSEAPHLEEVQALASQLPEVVLHLKESTAGQRLTSEDIINATDSLWPNVQVAFCGPNRMAESLKTSFKANGLRDKNFHQEAFEIRSGVGLDRLIIWVWKQINTQYNKFQKQ